MCETISFQEANYFANKAKSNAEARARIATSGRKETDPTDYELGHSADARDVIRETIDGFLIIINPVVVCGRCLYDTSVSRDGRVAYWYTSNVPMMAREVYEDYQFCAQHYDTELGLHGTYFSPRFQYVFRKRKERIDMG